MAAGKGKIAQENRVGGRITKRGADLAAATPSPYVGRVGWGVE
jgi:hypothetical protein